jgi:2-(1,2-epoxy-1,2-dihydrophenyl)acetyl-CoA isomerase
MMLDYSVDGHVAVLILNRPEVLNAFNDELGSQAIAAMERASREAQVRCIVLTGAGRAFSSGEDLGALAAEYEAGSAPDLGRVLSQRYNPLIRAIRASSKPVVAAVNGVAAGAGFSIALACDFRLASEHAKLVCAFIKVGLVPDSGATWFLTRILGTARALNLAATGSVLSAEEALGLGIVDKVVPTADFEPAWRTFAAELAAGPTRAFALTKRLIEAASENSLDRQLKLEAEAQSEAGKTQDHIEGVRAFLAKRSPDFGGR